MSYRFTTSTDHINAELSHLRLGRVEPHIFAISADEVGTTFGNVVVGHRLRRRVIRPIRIEPRMDENAAFMCLGDQKRERVERLRLSHLPGQKLRPRLELRSIDRIRHRPHLKDDGVEPQLFSEIENRDQLRLLLFDGQALFWSENRCYRPSRPRRRGIRGRVLAGAAPRRKKRTRKK